MDLLVHRAVLVATCDAVGQEFSAGWVAIRDGRVAALGGAGDPPPQAAEVLDADGCLVTPGLVNTHHHLFQNLTRAFAPALNRSLFGWLQRLYPVWAAIDTEASYLATRVGLAELALGGVTTSSDHLYIAPRGAGDLWTAQVDAARDAGVRLHATRGSMTLSTAEDGLAPPELVQDDEEVLADSERLVRRHHDPDPHAMVQMALAPCAPFNVRPALMRATAELAERLDVRLHTHLAEDLDDDAYCRARFGRSPVEHFEELGWAGPRSWVAHCVHPSGPEVARLGGAGVGVAHCPGSNMILGGGGICPVRDLREAGSPVGLGCDGSSSNDAASLWLEARTALLLARHRGGPTAMSARDVLAMATRGGAACLGRAGVLGELSPGSAGDLVVWDQTGPLFAGAHSDPVEAWLRCGPSMVRHTVVAGRVVVRDARSTDPGLGEALAGHARLARRLQALG